MLDPRRAETLDAEPGLAAISPEVRQLMSRLASTARLDAEGRLDQATHMLGQESQPQIAVLLAGRLLEAGGYANYIRSAELSQFAIRQVSSVRPSPGMRKLWLRGPLLVLLLIWGVGFLALIVFGFYANVRR